MSPMIHRIRRARLAENRGGVVAAVAAEICNWADRVRGERRDTAAWHYVDIPVEHEKFDEVNEGRDGDNVIDKLAEQAKILADSKRSKAERAEALKWVVHLVGDIHQPLHCAE